MAIQAPCCVKPELVGKPRRLYTYSLVPTFSALLKLAHQKACDRMKMRRVPLSTPALPFCPWVPTFPPPAPLPLPPSLVALYL